jgi:hypothetical protein
MLVPDFDAGRTRVFAPHYALTLDDVPAPGASWSDVIGFAGSLDGVAVVPEHHQQEQSLLACREAFARDGELPEGLTLLRAALYVEQRADYHAGEDSEGPDMRYIHALLDEIRRLVGAGRHLTPDSGTRGGVRDRVMNAYDRLLEDYAKWGGWRYYGWGGYEDPVTYMGPAVWSERDCDLKLAFELEREFPAAVHMEFPIAKWTRSDFVAPEARQRVDVTVSEFASFPEGADAYPRFKEHAHEAFFEVKWCLKGLEANSRELKARLVSIPEDLRKLANNVALGRCQVAGLVVFDDEGWFEQVGHDLSGGWPDGVWRLDVGPRALRWRGLITHQEYEQAVRRHA